MTQLTDRQEQAWQMRHVRGWSLDRIGRKLGIGKSAVSQLLARAQAHQHSAGLAGGQKLKRRTVRALSLSVVFNA